MHADLIGLGAIVLLAGLVARLGRRYGFPTVPCYMLIGIVFGPGTPGPVLVAHPEDLALLASLGLVLLLFHLGVEFPAEQVLGSGRRLFIAAGVYIALNVSAGLALGFALGWGTSEALVIAGALGISSSAIATKLLIELRRLTNAETPIILGVIVIEDMFLAFYLALLAPVLNDSGSTADFVVDLLISFGFLVALFALARWGARAIALILDSREDELLAILMVGLVVLVAGVALEVGVSEAIGALMIGLVVSRTALKERVEQLVLPLRDVFAAVFFISFGLTIDIADLGGIALPVAVAVLVTLATNLTAGVFTARLFGFNQRAATNIGLTVLGRGEFSLILATLAIAAGLDERMGPFVALYVLVLAIAAPLLASQSQHFARFVPDRLLRSRWKYVQSETMSTACIHQDQMEVTETDVGVCQQCLDDDGTWVQLRLCMKCGLVACCDDSPARHSRAHYEAEHHPVIQSLQPGADWQYCYVDEILVREPLGRTRTGD